jgi:hypothetical protein
MLGGYEVSISGPCFEPTSVVQGVVVETGVSFACVLNAGAGSRVVRCVMPTVWAVGVKTVTVLMDGTPVNYTGNFTFGE